MTSASNPRFDWMGIPYIFKGAVIVFEPNQRKIQPHASVSIVYPREYPSTICLSRKVTFEPISARSMSEQNGQSSAAAEIGSIPSRQVAAESQICASMVGRTNGCRGSPGVTNSRPETGTKSWKRTRRLSSRSSLFAISGWQRCLDDKALGSTGDIVVPSRWVNCAQQRSMSSELICPPLGWKVLTSGSPYFHIICDCLRGAFFGNPEMWLSSRKSFRHPVLSPRALIWEMALWKGIW